jgi:hypothetical protein
MPMLALDQFLERRRLLEPRDLRAFLRRSSFKRTPHRRYQRSGRRSLDGCTPLHKTALLQPPTTPRLTSGVFLTHAPKLLAIVWCSVLYA